MQTLERAHKLGCHHLSTSKDGQVAASVGFGGEINVWEISDGQWAEKGKIVGAISTYTTFRLRSQTAAHCISDSNKVGEAWAIALSENGQYLASTSFDGRINVWDNVASRIKIREFETKGSFGMAIDLVSLVFSIYGH